MVYQPRTPPMFYFLKARQTHAPIRSVRRSPHQIMRHYLKYGRMSLVVREERPLPLINRAGNSKAKTTTTHWTHQLLREGLEGHSLRRVLRSLTAWKVNTLSATTFTPLNPLGVLHTLATQLPIGYYVYALNSQQVNTSCLTLNQPPNNNDMIIMLSIAIALWTKSI